jgi:predicted nuclease with TOPRIM domain
VTSKVLFVKKGRKFLRFQIGTLKRVTKMFDLRRDREDITDCDIIGENQELVTNRDRLDRMNMIFRI